MKVLRNGHLLFDENNPGINQCFRMGFVHTETLKEPSIVCVIPSPLRARYYSPVPSSFVFSLFFFFLNHHASYIEHAYGHTDSVSFPFHKCPQIEVPCEQVLRNFSRQVLRQIRAGRRLGTSGQIRPLEASFQDEYYRSSWNVIPGIGVNSEYNAICDGRIDFLIPGPGWGVELLRDGDRIEDHSNRFGANGLYYSSIQTGVMKDWKIIDCRHSYPRKACNVPFTSGLMSFKVNLQGQFPRKDGFGRQCLEMIVPVCIFSTVKTRRLCRSSLSRIFAANASPLLQIAQFLSRVSNALVIVNILAISFTSFTHEENRHPRQNSL